MARLGKSKGATTGPPLGKAWTLAAELDPGHGSVACPPEGLVAGKPCAEGKEKQGPMLPSAGPLPAAALRVS